MNQGFINQIKAKIKEIDAYLSEHQHEMTQEQIDKALEKRSELSDLLDAFG